MTAAINTNLNSLSAQRQLGVSAGALGTAIARLSSGLRINSAKDDAAGLAVAERFTSQIKGTDQAARNSNDAISLVQTAEGALANLSSNLQRIRELAVQSANGTNSGTDRAALQSEVAQLVAENERIATQTEYNGVRLLDGSFSAQAVQLGANAGQTVTLGAINSMHSQDLGRFFGSNGAFNVSYDPAPQPLQVTVGTSTIYDLGKVSSDARAIVNAINDSHISGLSASALPTSGSVTQTSTGAVSGVATLTLNAVPISLSYAAGAASVNRAAAVAAVNAQSANTGVVATDNGQGITYTAADGRNIVASYSAGGATGSLSSDFGLTIGTLTAGINFTFRDPTEAPSGQISFHGAGIGGGSTITRNFAFLGNTGNGVAQSKVDISTVAGANAAIDSSDEALAWVNKARSQLGATQNRLVCAVANQQICSETLNASRSRIVDADFAHETANLSRAQILQQAGTAMVVQANQAPQGVLALLR